MAIIAGRPDGETGRRSGLKIRHPRKGIYRFDPGSGHQAHASHAVQPPLFSTSPLQGLNDLLATWRARYDTALMRPPDHDGALPTSVSAAWRLWCFASTGDGSTPFWRPWLLPQVQQRFVMARAPERAGPWVDALMCDLDGSLQLQAAGGRLAGILLRLRVKLKDMAWWRTRQPGDPWDAGYLHDTPSVRTSLGRFLPRRPTLLVARSPDPAFLARCAQTLSVRQSAFRHPVRLLVLGGATSRERRLE